MTLDITTEDDYLTINWTGVDHFLIWCKDNNLPTPFPKWGGGNPGEILDLAMDEDRGLVRQWMEAFASSFSEQVELGIAGAITDAYRDGRKATEVDDPRWYIWLATAWYYQLKSALDKRCKIRFG